MRDQASMKIVIYTCIYIFNNHLLLPITKQISWSSSCSLFSQWYNR